MSMSARRPSPAGSPRRRGDQIGADRARHAADDDPPAEPVAERRDDPDEVLVAREEQEVLMSGRTRAVLIRIDREVQVRPGDDLLASLVVGRPLGREVHRLETGHLEPHPDLGGVLVKIGEGLGHGHQAVVERLVAPDQRVRLSPVGVDRRVADILEIDEDSDLGSVGHRLRSSLAGHHGRSSPSKRTRLPTRVRRRASQPRRASRVPAGVVATSSPSSLDMPGQCSRSLCTVNGYHRVPVVRTGVASATPAAP
jgi:hypothetical protein